MGKFIDLIGERFERLIVTERSDNDKYGDIMWKCVCDCGNEIVTRSTDLQRGFTKSCGCLQKEKAVESNRKNLVGQRFGLVVVLSFYEKSRNNKAVWLCQCDCGTIFSTLSGSLITGRTSSCGCLLGESRIASELKKYLVEYYDAVTEHRVLKNSDTDRWLPYDIYLPNKNVFIEVHGVQHYKLNSWHVLLADRNNTTPQEEFEYQKKKDRMKRKFARQNGVYIEADLRKIKTVEKAIEYIESILKTL